MNIHEILHETITNPHLPLDSSQQHLYLDDLYLRQLFGDYYSPYYKLMYNITKNLGPKLVLELGVNKGCGIASMAAGNNLTKVIGVDQQRLPTINGILVNYPNVLFIQGSSTDRETHDRVKALGCKLGLIHFDTEHNFSQVVNEFHFWRELMEDGCVLLFDDSHACEGEVKRAVKSLPIGWFCECDVLHPVCGYMVGSVSK